MLGQCELVRRNLAFGTVKARQPQTIGFDLFDHARPGEQCDPVAARRQHAADKAPDTASACYGDGSVQNHCGSILLSVASDSRLSRCMRGSSRHAVGVARLVTIISCLICSAGLTFGRTKQWVYSTYSTECSRV